jgi:hypothetical protein
VTTAFHHDYPYRLRLAHPEYAELRIERKGRFLRVDPAEPVGDDDVVVLTAPAAHRARATVEALREGRRPTVVAAPAVLEWLGRAGSFQAQPFPTTVDGVGIDAMPYTPLRQARPLAHFLRASVQGARPVETFRRFTEQARTPVVEPHVLQLTFPDGARLLHLDLSLHRDTDPAWLERAAERFGKPEWLLVGQPWGETEAILTHVGRFQATRVLLFEVVNGERREMGLPTELVTPLRDRLVAQGVEAHVFATQASYRFE